MFCTLFSCLEIKLFSVNFLLLVYVHYWNRKIVKRPKAELLRATDPQFLRCFYFLSLQDKHPEMSKAGKFWLIWVTVPTSQHPTDCWSAPFDQTPVRYWAPESGRLGVGSTSWQPQDVQVFGHNVVRNRFQTFWSWFHNESVGSWNKITTFVSKGCPRESHVDKVRHIHGCGQIKQPTSDTNPEPSGWGFSESLFICRCSFRQKLMSCF